MKTAAFLLLWAISLLLTGCMHRRYLSEESPPDTLAHLNTDLGNLAGRAVFLDEHRVDANRFRFTADSLFCFSGHEVHPRVFPNSDIDRVVTLNHKAGAIDGLKYGAITGAVVGGIIGFLGGVMAQKTVVYSSPAPPDSSGHVIWHSAHAKEPDNPLLTMLYGAAIGGVSGSAVGVFLGYTGGRIVEVKYRFPVKK